MSKLYEKDIKQMLDQGQCLSSLPADAVLAVARLLRQQRFDQVQTCCSLHQSLRNLKSLLPRIHDPQLPNFEYDWTPGGD